MESLAASANTKKAIHVFASDSLPFPGCSRTAGGNRSMQIISALRNAGHTVTFGMPLHNFMAKQNANRALPYLTPIELWASENFFEPEVVLNRIQPDIAITCNINTFHTISRFSKDIVQIVDCYGPLQFEGLLIDNNDPEATMADPAMLEDRCRRLVDQMRGIDYLMTVSERQKYFWAAYCSMAGFAFNELDVLVCPAAFDVPAVARNTAPQLTVVYSGGFYPWQNPDRSLRAAATILETIPGATLHIFGGPHTSLPNAEAVLRMLDELQQFRCVKYHGYRPIEELTATLATAWCALELMERNIERELAVTGRTVEFLSAGTPVIYNDYSTLSKAIQKYNAGWTISPDNAFAGLQSIFDDLTQRGPALVEEISANARRLAADEFSPEHCMAPLVTLCNGPIARRRTHSSASVRRTSATKAAKSLGRVLTISPDSWGPLLEVRLSNPLRSLQQQGYVDSTTNTGISLDELKNDKTLYDIILTHRAIPETMYDLLDSLSLRFGLDVDDNVLANASYRWRPVETHILLGLESCVTLTVPTPRLAKALERYAGLSLADKTFVTPNALPFPKPSSARQPARPSQLLWIQSDVAALDRSKKDVVRAVEDFSRRYELPVLLIGRTVLENPQFTHQRLLGDCSFTALLQMLETAPTSIGIAPLETDADQQTLDFVSGKSDIKMLLFGGYGHPAVYSAAPPYTDSALQDDLTVVGNSYQEWRDALELQYAEAWKNMGTVASRIQSERHVDLTARESWLPALQACVLSKPVRGVDLYEASRDTARLEDAPPRPLAYIFAKSGILNHSSPKGSDSAWKYDALLQQVQNEERARSRRLQKRIAALESELKAAKDTLSSVLHSTSWRVTAPLRKISELGK
jgi:glycosyltransferase involved in cell wall biosynthesis